MGGVTSKDHEKKRSMSWSFVDPGDIPSEVSQIGLIVSNF